MSSLGQDVRYALRQLRRRFGFSVTVIVTLALGIGANLALFQLLQGLLFSQLPITRPAELYSLHAVKSPFDGQYFYSWQGVRTSARGDGRTRSRDRALRHGQWRSRGGRSLLERGHSADGVGQLFYRARPIAGRGTILSICGRIGWPDGTAGHSALRLRAGTNSVLCKQSSA